MALGCHGKVVSNEGLRLPGSSRFPVAVIFRIHSRAVSVPLGG